MTIRGALDYGGEEQRVFQKALDRFDKERRKIPCVGERRGEGSGMFEIRIERRRFLEIVQVFEGSGVSRDVLFVRRFQ